MREIWKDIPGYDGIYKISNFGKVKHFVHIIDHKTGEKIHSQEKLLRISPKGAVRLRKEKREKGVRVSRLVYELFSGQFDPSRNVYNTNLDLRDCKITNLSQNKQLYNKNKNQRKKCGFHLLCKERCLDLTLCDIDKLSEFI